MIRFAFVFEVLWLFAALGIGSAPPRVCTTSSAESASQLQRLEANPNQTHAGFWENGALKVDHEVTVGKWFPEDEYAPGLTMFALAERGKPAQIP
jgi:hypothetical protein